MLVYQRVTNHVAVSEVIDPQVTMGLLKWFNDLDDFGVPWVPPVWETSMYCK